MTSAAQEMVESFSGSNVETNGLFAGHVRKCLLEAGIWSADGEVLNDVAHKLVIELQTRLAKALEESEEFQQRLTEVQEKYEAVKEDAGKKAVTIKRLRADGDRQLQNSPHYEDAMEVLNYWSEVLMPGAKKLAGGERLKNVINCLSTKDGKPFTIEELKLCIRGYAAFPYVVSGKRTAYGSPGQRKIDAELIFRDPGRVENGKAMAIENERRKQPLPQVAMGPTESHPTPRLGSLGMAAVRLADFGFYVFPVAPKAKIPVTPNGLKDATRDIERITAFWSSHPQHNIGVRCGIESGLVVLDVDISGEDEGTASLRTLEKAHEPLPATASVVTPSGGQHYYFRHPDEGEIRNTTAYPGPGLDIRACGGYVLAPPSIGANGNRYEVDASVEIAPLPRWLLEILIKRQSEPKIINTDWAEFLTKDVPEGKRNSEMTRLVGHFWSHDHEPAEVLAIVNQANKARFKPPLDIQEIEKIVLSIARREARRALKAVVS